MEQEQLNSHRKAFDITVQVNVLSSRHWGKATAGLGVVVEFRADSGCSAHYAQSHASSVHISFPVYLCC